MKTVKTSALAAPRQSNIELLRLVAMFMVLVVHTNFVPLGAPNLSSFIDRPLVAGGRVALQLASVMCVNVFVFISGWFGIRATFRSFMGFVFQCLWFYLLMYILIISLGISSFVLGIFARSFWFGDSCWFEKSYALLFIVSPVLNVFMDSASRRRWGFMLIAFFAFEFMYGLSASTKYLDYGYSPVSFIGIYLLAGYVRRYGTSIHNKGLLIYWVSLLLNCVLYFVLCFVGREGLTATYLNPLVISGTVGLFLWFNGMKTGYNQMINYIARSNFGVYLIHTCSAIWVPVFLSVCSVVYAAYSGLAAVGMILLFILFTFIAGIFFDLPRRYLWGLIEKRMPQTNKLVS